MGPWRAAQRFTREIETDRVKSLRVDLYGSLAKTGKGHGTDLAVLLGLNGDDPVTIPVEDVYPNIHQIEADQQICLGGKKMVPFNVTEDIVFHFDQALPFHANGLRFSAFYEGDEGISQTYYSVGGGFVVKEGEEDAISEFTLPYPIDYGKDLEACCKDTGKCIHEVVWENELTWRSEEKIRTDLLHIWEVMKQCIYTGCHTDGVLPGGLEVSRRAKAWRATGRKPTCCAPMRSGRRFAGCCRSPGAGFA